MNRTEREVLGEENMEKSRIELENGGSSHKTDGLRRKKLGFSHQTGGI